MLLCDNLWTTALINYMHMVNSFELRSDLNKFLNMGALL